LALQLHRQQQAMTESSPSPVLEQAQDHHRGLVSASMVRSLLVTFKSCLLYGEQNTTSRVTPGRLPPPGLAPLVEEKGNTFISLAHKMFLKDRNITRMEEDQYYVPVSARVSFKLQAWKEAEASPEFATLNSETTALVKTFLLQLNQQIIANIKLEQSVLATKILKELYESLFVIVELLMEALGKNPEFTHEMVLACL
jgi:hypothetical protein